MTTLILFGSFAILLFLSVPIGIALGMASLITLFYSEITSLEYLAQTLVSATDSFTLMAVPFFILAGEIMGKGGISKRLFELANVFVGRFTGGFAMAAVLTCMFFAAISGSGPATVAAVGGIMIPAMVSYGYDKKFATAVVACSGALGIIIPPSIPMVVYGVSASQSIGDLFIAGVIPGIVIGILLMAWAYIYSRKMGYTGVKEKMSVKDKWKVINDSKWAVFVPILILGGIYGGILTPTEAAVIAVVYALIIGMFVYKEVKIKDIAPIMYESALTSATILLIIGTASTFGKILTLEQIPQMVAEGILSISDSPFIVLLLINLLLLFVGMIMDTTAAIILLTPILLPIATKIGVDPIHFGIIMIVNLAIGFITPPVGVNLFVGSSISGIRMEVLAKASLPFMFSMLLGLTLIVVIPELSLFLIDIFK
ncbi:TRAP transporter large permease [Lysinibacillus telephonicus]|uniref:TRAP transporter large permease n=1 Tax=Lysinibacillus telephonicus TaxID=1714840 RepID=A0A3S0QWL2_9BACI|nr:TRAP transporter large permease [Lysinibacillus telephonicus]RTQ94127.1 TRAP transporter large permease [Lysinibacillus telephonicus]